MSLARIVLELAAAVMIAASAFPDAGPAKARETSGGRRDPLVTNEPPVSVEDQERLGLVAIQRTGFRRHCSAVLLSNDRVATAAHRLRQPSDRQAPLRLQVVANWREAAGASRAGVQVRDAAAVYSYWGHRVERPGTSCDIALIRLADHLWVNGQPTGYRRPIDGTGL